MARKPLSIGFEEIAVDKVRRGPVPSPDSADEVAEDGSSDDAA